MVLQIENNNNTYLLVYFCSEFSCPKSNYYFYSGIGTHKKRLKVMHLQVIKYILYICIKKNYFL